jgi:hypothetical protein
VTCQELTDALAERVASQCQLLAGMIARGAHDGWLRQAGLVRPLGATLDLAMDEIHVHQAGQKTVLCFEFGE